MEIASTRFGKVEYAADCVLHFPEGLPGLAEDHDWVLLADPGCDAVAWMQSVARPELALAVASPRRFVSHYQLRVCRHELEPLGLDHLEDAEVLAIVSKTDRGLVLNLKAPLVIHLPRRWGRQVVANGEASMQYELGSEPAVCKKIA
jgi:flagellar assembly factor FliW